MKKLVSIIMNCYNGEEFLKYSIESVINQTYKNFELIFYDNCSTDKSREIFHKYRLLDKRLKYYKSSKKENLGLARYNAFKKVKGTFFLFLDTDDLMLPDKINSQIKSFVNKKIGAVYTNSLFFSKNFRKPLYRISQPKERSFYNLIEKYDISLDTVIFNTKLVKKLKNPLDKRFNLIHDLDLIIRLSRFYRIRYLSKILSNWRVHTSSTSSNSYLRFAKEKKLFHKKIKKIYPRDTKLENSLKKFSQEYLLEEIVGLILENKNNKARKLIFTIDDFYKRLIFKIIINIPFNRLIIGKIIYFKKFFL